MTIYKVLDETFVSRSDATRQLVYREKYFIPNGITRGYLKMGHMIVYCGNNKWNVVERGYSIPEINKMVVVGNVEYKELTSAVAKVVLEKAEAQTGEVAPVVHGYWIQIDDGVSAKCGICGACACDLDEGFEEFAKSYRYCPHCGAKMDGETQNEKPKG